MEHIRRIDVSLTFFDLLFALSLIILNEITGLNLSPDYFTFFNLFSLVILYFSGNDEIWIEASTSTLHVGLYGYFFSILLNKAVE